jgi:thioredoxin-related protein
VSDAVSEITWYTWEDAIELNKTTNKKVIVDLYTDWCGWCKKMDRETFKDPQVAAYIAENFIAVKLDGEHKESITYKAHEFKFVDRGRRGYHELAYSLLEGKMSYPTFVFLDENEERIMISPGYKDAKAMLKQLVYIADEHYKTKKFQDFSEAYDGN